MKLLSYIRVVVNEIHDEAKVDHNGSIPSRSSDVTLSNITISMRMQITLHFQLLILPIGPLTQKIDHGVACG